MVNEVYNNSEVLEVEMLELIAGGNSYGVNVSDIREILPYVKKPKPIPNSQPFIEGIMMPRDFLIPIVNLMECLRLKPTENILKDMLIITSIKNLNIAFHVDGVKGIMRVMNTDIKKPIKNKTTTNNGTTSGILRLDDRIIEILDLRKIMLDINPEVEVE
jgi:two-component system chemotaxis response regulator CheV